MNDTNMYHSKFGNLETIRLSYFVFSHHSRYTSNQTTSIVQFQLKVDYLMILFPFFVFFSMKTY